MYVAIAIILFTFNFLEDDHDAGENGRDRPRYGVKPLALDVNRLLAPLHSGGEKPGDGQHHPPD